VSSAAFYCVTDARHFTGAVALLNSLRLVGHEEPFVVSDCGLTPRQRALLEPHAEIQPAPAGVAPMLLKPAAALARPAGVMVVLDADVIVTRSLAALMREAAAGRIVTFVNDNPERTFPEWADLLGAAEARRQPYVASGHLFLDGVRGRSLLERLDEVQSRLDLERTLLGRGSTPANPFHYPDMDALNAILACEIAPEHQLAVDYRLAPHAPFDGVALHDEARLRCAHADGTEPYVLHHVLGKPWLARTARNIYSLLLPRLLLGDDVELRLERRDVPLRLRTGRAASADRRLSDLHAAVSPHVRGRLGIRPRVQSWLATRAHA
jgi:hypothetical protein